MSAAARWIIAIIGSICAISFALVAAFVPPGVLNRADLWVMAGFCSLITVACFPSRFRIVAIRLIGAAVCIFEIDYIVSQIGHPLPNLQNYRESDTNLVNAVISFLVFGVPGGLVALSGFLPNRRQP